MTTKTVLITGGTGLLGKALSKLLIDRGHEVRVLSRSKRESQSLKFFQWNVAGNYIEEGALDGVDIIVHLAGASIAKRWTEAHRKAIISSRVDSAQLLLTQLQKNNQKLEAFISAAASGIYQPDKGIIHEETSSALDNGFLGHVCKQWEASADEFKVVSQRVVKHRIGIILSPEGGALEKMLPPFKFGLAPYFGNGQMYYAWIHLQDVAKQFLHSIEKPLEGIYNCSTSNVTVKGLNKTISKAMNKGTIGIPAPRFAMKIMLGEMSRIVLDSVQMNPSKVQATELERDFPDLNEAMKDLIG